MSLIIKKVKAYYTSNNTTQYCTSQKKAIVLNAICELRPFPIHFPVRQLQIHYSGIPAKLLSQTSHKP